MIIHPTPRPAVKAAIDILEVAFPTLTVDTRIPRTRPDQFIKVTRVGGGMLNPVTDVARILVECWAKTNAAAEAMSATAREALANARGTTVADDVFIRGYGNEEGPVDYPDLDTGMDRYQFHGDLYVSTRQVENN